MKNASGAIACAVALLGLAAMAACSAATEQEALLNEAEAVEAAESDGVELGALEAPLVDAGADADAEP